MEKAKNVDEYIARQRAALASNPECGTTHYNLAVALLGLKKYEEAEKELYEAIECSPSLAEAYVQLGGIRLMQGDLDGSLSFNQRAINARAGFSEGHGNIGFVLLQQGKIDEAIRSLEKAIAYNAKFLQAYATLANAYLMQGQIDKSIETNRKVLKIEPAFAVAHNNLTIAYLEKDEHQAAIGHYERAIALGYDVAPELAKEIETLKSEHSG